MTESTVERELQFEAPDLEACERWIAAQPSHALLSFQGRGITLQKDEYQDTAGWAVWRAGYALRVRRRPDGDQVTLKARKDDGADVRSRREISQSYDQFVAGEGGSNSPASAVRLVTNGGALEPLIQVETRRTDYAVLEGANQLATLSLDDSTILRDGSVVRTLRRVEVEEVVDDGIERLRTFVEGLVEACQLTPAGLSKFEAGLEAAGLEPRAAFDYGYAEREPDAGVGEYAYAVLRGYFRDFVRNEPGARLGEDPEYVHDMRVATRRLRAAMALFRTVLPLRFTGLRDELKWIAAALGEVRDLDVQLEWLIREREGARWSEGTAIGALIEDVRASHEAARTRLIEALSSERYTRLEETMATALREGELAGNDASQPVRRFAPKRLRKRYRRLRVAAKGLTPDSEPAHYHEARILAKRLRYATDSFLPLYSPAAKELATSTARLQDVLGEHQDCVVAIQSLRRTVETKGSTLPPLTLFCIGEITQQRRQRMAELRIVFPDSYDELRAAWRRFRRELKGRHQNKDVEPEAQDEPSESLTQPPAGVQRPFSVFRRFFSRSDGQ